MRLDEARERVRTASVFVTGGVSHIRVQLGDRDALLESEARLRELLAEWLEVTSHYAPPKGPLADETRAALGETE